MQRSGIGVPLRADAIASGVYNRQRLAVAERRTGRGVSGALAPDNEQNRGRLATISVLWSQQGMILRLPDYESGALTN